ncbi:hypothetical protein ACHAXS_010293 [Conticribra weissflogii]
MAISPEAAIKKLARSPPNLTCPNCGTYSKYGFTTICIKYHTFVCNACKSSHQAVSHRCKSLTMSSWDHGEVLALQTKGNDYARRVWLAYAPEVGAGGRPREGDDIGVFKRFVVEVYEKRRYYKEDDGGATDGAVGASASAGHAQTRQKEAFKSHPSGSRSIHNTIGSNCNYNGAGQWGKKQTTLSSQPAAAPAPKPPAAAPTVDLLDFGNFDSALPHPTAPSSQSNSQSDHRDVFDPFNNRDHPTSNAFDAVSISSAPAKQLTSVTTSTTNNTSDDDFFNSLQSGNAPLTSSVATAPPTAMADPFDPFHTMDATPSMLGAQQQQTQQQQNRGEKKPIMNTFIGISTNANTSHSVNNCGNFVNNNNNFNGNNFQPSMFNNMNMMNASSNSVNNDNMMMMNVSGIMNNSSNSGKYNHNMMMNEGNMMNGGMISDHNTYNNNNNIIINNNNMMMTNNNYNNSSMQGGAMGIMTNNANENGNVSGIYSGIMNGNNQGMQATKPNNNYINNLSIKGNTANGNSTPAMSMNIMQSRNNSITNHFGMPNTAGGRGGSEQKEDPFAGLGF